MTIPYCIISISDERNDNILNIKSVFGYEPEETKSFDVANVDDIILFNNLYPNFQLDTYLCNKKYVTNPNRSDGEIGCWMSHYSAWQYMLSKGYEKFFIVEDDCFLTETKLKEITDEIDAQGYELFLAGQWAEFYYMNSRAARFLVDNAIELGYHKTPVDEYMFDAIREYGFGGRFWGNLVSQISIGGKSQINEKKRAF